MLSSLACATLTLPRTMVRRFTFMALTLLSYLLTSAAGNEQDVGKAVHAALASGVDRAELFIATKLANDKHDPEVVESTVHESLRKLQCRHIDLLYVHWPFAPEIEPVRPALRSCADSALASCLLLHCLALMAPRVACTALVCRRHGRLWRLWWTQGSFAL